MTDTLAKIRGKGCQSTGITEELARQLHSSLGRKVMCVVELAATSRTEDSDGKETVALTILSVEPAMDDEMSEHLRELQRHMWKGRSGNQVTIEEQMSNQPSVRDQLDRGRALVAVPDEVDA